MAKQYKTLSSDDIEFINKQKLFYIASCSGKEVNLSPRGFECLHVLDKQSILFLDYPGSGNRTARDIKDDGEITVVFNAFSGSAQLLRLFCKGQLIEKYDFEFNKLFEHFNEKREYVRRIVRLNIYTIESSCGMGVPKMQFQKERSGLKKWIKAQSEDGTLKNYIQEHDEPVDLSQFKE